MFIFTLFSTFLVVLRVRAVYDELEHDTLDPIVSPTNIHGYTLCAEPTFHGVRFHLVRRLLEHPRWTKEAYRSNDYNVIHGQHHSRYKSDESRSYRSAVKDDEDNEDDDEEEEEEGDEENEINEGNKIDNEAIDDEDEQDENENEETVGDVAGNRVPRSNYVPFGDGIGVHERQEVVRVRSANEECEDESTEVPQYYEYEAEVKNAASQDSRKSQKVFVVNILGVNLLILLFI